MMKKPILLILIDSLLLNITIYSVFSIRFFGSVPDMNIKAYIQTLPYITAMFVLLFYLNGLYDYNEMDDGVSIFFRVFSSIGLGTISLMALTFLGRAFAFPRTVILISYLTLLFFFSIWRLYVQNAFLQSLPSRRAVIYGNEERVEHLKKMIASEGCNFSLVGTIMAGDDAKLAEILQSGEADCVIITDDVSQARSIAFNLFLKFPEMIVFLVPKPSDIMAGAKHRIVIGDVPLIALSHKAILGRFIFLKRFADLSFSLLSLVLLIPLTAIVAIAVKVSSKGPVFYLQTRTGRRGREFKTIKFRTMLADAEEKSGPTLSTEDDPRVTPVGRFLRLSKIDELPQIINVIKGEMSIVGPRPERPVFVNEFEKKFPAYNLRHSVLPGITGLAQVTGRYESDASVKLIFDLLYIYNYHPLLDAAIVYRTAQYVVRELITKKIL